MLVSVWSYAWGAYGLAREATGRSNFFFLVLSTGHKWAKNLALSRELDVSVALSGKPSKTSPAVTALAITR